MMRVKVDGQQRVRRHQPRIKQVCNDFSDEEPSANRVVGLDDNGFSGYNLSLTPTKSFGQAQPGMPQMRRHMIVFREKDNHLGQLDEDLDDMWRNRVNDRNSQVAQFAKHC